MEPENQLTSTLHSNIAQPAIGVVQTFEEKLLRKLEIKYWRKTRWIWNSQKIRRSDLCPCCKRLRLFVKMNTTAAIVISFLNASSLRCKSHAFRSETIGVWVRMFTSFFVSPHFSPNQPLLACPSPCIFGSILPGNYFQTTSFPTQL